jgi:dimethylargininase
VSTAITREVPASITRCELTHLARTPIDLDVARDQHNAYELALRSSGFDVRRLPEEPELPDSVFVEDAAVVLPEVAVITRPGAESRRAETASVEAALAPLRTLLRIEAPGTLDGGDVLVLDREVVVGRSERSNAEGFAQLTALLSAFGYRVRSVPMTGCLHLKTAVTRVGDRMLVINPEWVSESEFPGWSAVAVDPREPFAANALWIAGGEGKEATVIYSKSFPETCHRLERAGVRVVTVPASELAKAEGGVTCCSLLVT